MARAGERRDVVESRLGPPMHPGPHRRAVYGTSPRLVLTYTDDDTVELVEVAYSGDGGEEVFFDHVQLTFRFMDDVVADLAARGHRHEPTDIGYRFEPGFAVFSMGSRTARDLDQNAAEDDSRKICEGVSVAPYGYFAGPSEDEIVAYIRSREAARGALFRMPRTFVGSCGRADQARAPRGVQAPDPARTDAFPLASLPDALPRCIRMPMSVHSILVS